MLAGAWLVAGGPLAGVVLPGYLRGARDRQPAYAALFARSHASLLLPYPLAGWLGAARAYRRRLKCWG